MHPTILIKRKAIAVNRIVERAKALVERLELDPALAEALEPKVKDTDTVDMLRMEALAELIAQLAEMAGVPPEEQPDTTVREFIAQPESAPDASMDVTAVTSTDEEAESQPVEELIGPDGLPAPTLDDVESSDDQVADGQAETLAPETEPSPEEEIAAEEPAPELIEEPSPAEEQEPPAKPKRTSKKSKGKS